jgi:hypothetical protein
MFRPEGSSGIYGVKNGRTEMNNSITPDQLEADLRTSRERLLVREQDHVDATARRSLLEETLKQYGVARMFLNERRGDLAVARKAIGETWTEKIITGVRDLVPGAVEFQQIVQETNLLAVVGIEITEDKEPAARENLLEAVVAETGAWADIKSLESDIHRLTVLRAGGAVAELEGEVHIRGAESERLARIAYQAIQDFEQAKSALASYREIQAARRAQSSGPVQYQNR